MINEEKPAEAVRLSKSERRVIDLLSRDEESTQEELARQCGLSLSGVKKVMRGLQEKGLLERQGARKNGAWVLLRSREK